MYRQTIKFLEESHQKIDDELFFLQKSQSSNNTEKILELTKRKNDVLSELSNLRKLQYEYEYQRVDFTDYDR